MHDQRSSGHRGAGARASCWAVLTVVLIAASGTAKAASKISIGPQSPLGFSRDSGIGAPGDVPGKPQTGFFELRNTGTTKLKVTRMEIGGPDAAIMAFNGAFDPFCGSGRVCAQDFTLEAGQSRGFQTICTPTQPGVFSAALDPSRDYGGVLRGRLRQQREVLVELRRAPPGGLVVELEHVLGGVPQRLNEPLDLLGDRILADGRFAVERLAEPARGAEPDG